MNYYALNYGASYISEYYHYLNQSTFAKNILTTKQHVNVKSLGCGFAPDFHAIQKYIYDKNLDCQLHYTGYDISHQWDDIRPNTSNVRFINNDITTNIDLIDADIIVIGKVFSTLVKNNKDRDFIAVLTSAINNTMQQGSVIIFNDVNIYKLGRDIFHSSVYSLFSAHNQFYFEGYTGQNWTQINQHDIIYPIPVGLSVHPKQSTGKTVIFEYRK